MCRRRCAGWSGNRDQLRVELICQSSESGESGETIVDCGGEGISGVLKPDDGRGVPVRAELLELHDRGADRSRGDQGNVAGAVENIAVSSVREIWIRSGSVQGTLEERV